MFDSLEPQAIHRIIVDRISADYKLTTTDFRIIEYLLLHPRSEIREIAGNLALSTKTISRQLQKMEEKRVFFISVKWDPPSAKNFIRFLLFIYVEPSHYEQVSRKIYNELKENSPQLHPISKPPVLLYSMITYDIFVVDSILAMVKSWNEILDAEIFIPENITLFSDWITSRIKKFSH